MTHNAQRSSGTGVDVTVLHQQDTFKLLGRQTMRSKHLLPYFRLQGGKPEIFFWIIIDHKLYKSVTKITDTIKEYGWGRREHGNEYKEFNVDTRIRTY